MTRQTLLAAVLIVIAFHPAMAESESDIRERLCAEVYQESTMPLMGGRADCITPHYAIEIDWSEKWAEAVGQALYYASQTGKVPGVILLCRKAEADCLKHALRAEAALARWKIHATIWECGASPQTLNDCKPRQVSGSATP